MKHGAMAHGQKTENNAARQTFAAAQVSVIDSIIITEELDTDTVLAEWIAYDPTIEVYSELTSGQSTKLFINWSDRNGTIDLHQGDYFTFVVPDIFVYDYITNIDNEPITNEVGEVVAIYSIYDNSANMKEVRISFTDFVENHTDVYGNFWMVLYVGSVASTEEKTLEFVINDSLAAQGGVTVNPNMGTYTPFDQKVGFSSPDMSVGGYYIFEWSVYFNMTENSVNGFNTLVGFTFEDIIPAESPHVFLTDALRQQLGLSPGEYATEIGEYIGADSTSPQDRYRVFQEQYSNTDGGSWYENVEWHNLSSGLETDGINDGGGLNVTGIEVADKLFSANLGTVTRPTVIVFYTIATINIAESALGDTQVVGLFSNIFNGSYGEEINASLTLYRFGAGGSAQGISGDYSFEVKKVSESGDALPGAMFSLFTSLDFGAGADRFVFSGGDGIVSFVDLPEGTYYMLESSPPYGYLPNSTVYMVVLDETGYEVYYGPNFEYRLSENNYEIPNTTGIVTPFVVLVVSGSKNLTGAQLNDDMFSFSVKDSEGNIVATGKNNADGSIVFGGIFIYELGVHTFTVEEVKGDTNGIIYDGSVFTVIATVTLDENDLLSLQVSYPDGAIVFNNRYSETYVVVSLEGQKNLTGTQLTDGMFNFIVKDSDGVTVSYGTNGADGKIHFSDILLYEPGAYRFTVEEVRGGDDGIVYDGSIFTVDATVTAGSNGELMVVINYPEGGIVFNNIYITTPEKPCKCLRPCGSLCLLPCRSSCKTMPIVHMVRKRKM